MAESSWPFEGQSTTEAQFSAWAKRLIENGIISGLTLSASSGMNVAVAVGSAIVEGFYYENTGSSKVLAVGAAPGAGLTRRDYVILRLDLVANTITAVVKAGTATSGGGTLPALTQSGSTFEFPIGIVTVAAGTISLSAGNIAEVRTLLGLRVIPYASDAARPTPATTALGVNTTTKRLELFVGGVWSSLTPDVTWDSVTGKPSTFAPSAHTHAWTEITGKPGTFAPDPHTHDDRYFTESEITALLAGKSATGHTHAWTEITSKPSTFAPSAHTHAWGDIVSGVPATFAPSAHTHAAADITSGTLADARIPLLDGAKINRGDITRPVNNGNNNYVGAAIVGGGYGNGGCTVAANGDVAADGLGTFNGAWNLDVSAVTRRAVWMRSDGTLGHTASSRRYKQGIRATALDVDKLMQIEVVDFEYKIDPTVSDTGVIAEDIAALGFDFLVDREPDGTIEGVHYDRLALAALKLAQSLGARVAELEARLGGS